MTKKELLEIIKTIGITQIGIASVESLADLPKGKILDTATLLSVFEVLPTVKSAIILTYKVWDPIFNIVAMGPIWLKKNVPLDSKGIEFYQLSSQVLDSKAWIIANYLQRKGFDSKVTRRIALKPSAVKAGLGCRGKNTLVINPSHGPFVRFAAVLTEAVFDPDDVFLKDLCNACTKCIDACPTKALKPYEIDIRRCLTYAAENPLSSLVEEDVRALEKKLIRKPSLNSFIECTICQDVCPIGANDG